MKFIKDCCCFLFFFFVLHAKSKGQAMLMEKDWNPSIEYEILQSWWTTSSSLLLLHLRMMCKNGFLVKSYCMVEELCSALNQCTGTPRLKYQLLLGADHLTLEWGGGWFWKKISCKRLSEEKNCMQHKCYRELMGKKGKKISLMTRNHPPPPSRVKWSAPYSIINKLGVLVTNKGYIHPSKPNQT